MARHGVSAAERRRIAAALERAALATEREAVRIVREVYERIKHLPPEEALAVLREAMGPASEQIALTVTRGMTAAAFTADKMASARLGGGWRSAARLLRERYAREGGMRLSPRIFAQSAEVLRGVERAVASAVANGRGAVELAYTLRDRVKYDPAVVLTKRLDEIREKARAAMVATGDPRALRAFRRTAATLDRYASKLRRTDFGMGAATEHALDQIARAVERGSEEAVDRALHWWTYDKQAYHARMTARTETARAFTDGFKSNADVPWVVGFRWNVESIPGRKRDICDVLGNQNLYGLGPGVYPFDRVPECPAHPNCNCYLTEEMDESITDDDQRPAAPPQRQGATKAWLQSQPASVQREILGAGGYEAFRRSHGRELPAWLRV